MLAPQRGQMRTKRTHASQRARCAHGITSVSTSRWRHSRQRRTVFTPPPLPTPSGLGTAGAGFGWADAGKDDDDGALSEDDVTTADDAPGLDEAPAAAPWLPVSGTCGEDPGFDSGAPLEGVGLGAETVGGAPGGEAVVAEGVVVLVGRWEA